MGEKSQHSLGPHGCERSVTKRNRLPPRFVSQRRRECHYGRRGGKANKIKKEDAGRKSQSSPPGRRAAGARIRFRGLLPCSSGRLRIQGALTLPALDLQERGVKTSCILQRAPGTALCLQQGSREQWADNNCPCRDAIDNHTEQPPPPPPQELTNGPSPDEAARHAGVRHSRAPHKPPFWGLLSGDRQGQANDQGRICIFTGTLKAIHSVSVRGQQRLDVGNLNWGGGKRERIHIGEPRFCPQTKGCRRN